MLKACKPFLMNCHGHISTASPNLQELRHMHHCLTSPESGPVPGGAVSKLQSGTDSTVNFSFSLGCNSLYFWWLARFLPLFHPPPPKKKQNTHNLLLVSLHLLLVSLFAPGMILVCTCQFPHSNMKHLLPLVMAGQVSPLRRATLTLMCARLFVLD